MNKAIAILSGIIVYGIYSVANGGTDIFTMFWNLVARFLGG